MPQIRNARFAHQQGVASSREPSFRDSVSPLEADRIVALLFLGSYSGFRRPIATATRELARTASVHGASLLHGCKNIASLENGTTPRRRRPTLAPDQPIVSSTTCGRVIERELNVMRWWIVISAGVASGLGCSARSPQAVSSGGNNLVDADGSVDTSTQVVTSADIAGDVATCPDGYAHPLVCCTSAPGQQVVCLEHPTAPFQACDANSFGYPDGQSCCSLENDADCRPASNLPNDASANANCYYPCGPGGYPPSELSTATGLRLCEADTQAACVYCCYDDQQAGASCPSNGCSCPVNIPPPCPCPTLECNICPVGWGPANSGQGDLCCRLDRSGECFSQAIKVLDPV